MAVGPLFEGPAVLVVSLDVDHQLSSQVVGHFRHIVRYDKIRLFNVVNLEQGYRAIQIHTPREVTNYGPKRDQGS